MGALVERTGAALRAWARPGSCVAGVVLCAAIVTYPFGTVAGASSPTKAVFAYYNLHPCALITQKQVVSVFRVSVGPGAAVPSRTGGGQCRYDTKGAMANGDLGSVIYGFGIGTAAAQKYFNPGTDVNEPSLGHGTWCQVKGSNRGALYANVGTYSGSAEYLNIGGDNSCAYSVQFTKDAFARLL